jgi:hypothetical protein
LLIIYRKNDTVFDRYLIFRIELLLEREKRRDVLLYTLSLRRIVKLGEWSATVTARLRIATLLCDNPLHAADIGRSNSPFRSGNLLLQRNRLRKLSSVVKIINFNQDLRNALITVLATLVVVWTYLWEQVYNT